MRITVTGGSGFIGSRLVTRLDAAGHAVHMLGRAPRKGLHPNVRYTLWDPRKPPPAEALEGCEAIFHLAGEPVAQRWSPEVKKRIRDSRVESTRILVETLAGPAVKPKVLIASSASGYYGGRGDEVLTETSPAGKGFLAEVCVEWENAARLAQSLGIRVVVVRIGFVLGPSGGALARMLPVYKAGLGGRLGSGDQWLPWVHLEDLVDLFEFALDNSSLKGALNGASPNPVTNSDFALTLGRVLHRPALIPVPRFALQLLYGEMAGILFESQRLSPAAAQAAGFSFRHPELFAALKDLLK